MLAVTRARELARALVRRENAPRRRAALLEERFDHVRRDQSELLERVACGLCGTPVPADSLRTTVTPRSGRRRA